MVKGVWSLLTDLFLNRQRIVWFIAGRYWEMVERLRINQIYTAPTAIRLLLKAGKTYTLQDESMQQYKRI